MRLIMKFLRSVFPKVNTELQEWADVCKNAKDKVLSNQALDSIRLKRFHAQGGSIYALYPHASVQGAVRFIVALQTISDYLDNLCDRTGVNDEASFRQLHLSMLDAVDPRRSLGNYYSLYPYKDDGGYLKKLVEECRSQISLLPSYGLVADTIRDYVGLYTELQCCKHLDREVREERVVSWAAGHMGSYPEISVWEFAAASGSTLGIFCLTAAAYNPMLTAYEVDNIKRAYFPWVCGLHILLDYYIDSQEDLQTGDLNFTYYYENLKQCEERLSFFIGKSLEQCSKLNYTAFHITVVRGLLAMYLSDPKASIGLNRFSSRRLVRKGKGKTGIYYRLCRLLRLAGVI